MKNKKVLTVALLIIVIISTFILGYFYFGRKNASKNLSTAELPIPQLSFQNSLPVGTIVKLPKLISVSGRTIPDNTKRVFVFVSRTCGSCEYISIAIPNLAKTFGKLTWIYIEKSDEPPIIGNPKINNLYIIKNSKTNLSSIFKSKYTPTFFLVDKDNKIVWKRRGFIIPDYYNLKNVLSAFQNNNYSLLKETYQRNLEVGKPFPKVIAYTYPEHKKITLPDDFKGKPTLIFIFHYSCKACLTAMNAIPKEIKRSDKINKIIVFSPFSEKLNKEAINFAEEYGFREIIANLKSPIIRVQIDNVKNCFSLSSNVFMIEDKSFRFQYSIGWPGSPTLFVISKKGILLKEYYLGNETTATLKNFYKRLLKTLKT